jgi:hypothetical protein
VFAYRAQWRGKSTRHACGAVSFPGESWSLPEVAGALGIIEPPINKIVE